MAQLTDQGFVGKTQNEYFEEEQQLYRDIDPNWNLDPSTPDGLKTASDAEVFGNLDETARLAYNSKDPNKARGVDLNIIGSLTGSMRDEGTPSTVSLLLGGLSGTLVPGGSTVRSSEDDSEWLIDDDVVIGVGGTVVAAATCTVSGVIQADPDTLTVIGDTVPGWQTVTNSAAATAGTPEETNAEFRLRRALSVGRPGNNQIDSMLGEVGATDGVRRFKIYENDTDAPLVIDNITLPSNSIAPIVDGGTDADVAFAIYVKKNPGVQLYAAGTSVQVNVQSPVYPANTKLITFSRPIYVDTVVVVDITNDGSLPPNVVDLVTQSIIDYATTEFIATDVGFNTSGFDIAEDVPASRMYTPVNQVIGAYGNSFITGVTVNAGSLLDIKANELSRWTSANITVNVT